MWWWIMAFDPIAFGQNLVINYSLLIKLITTFGHNKLIESNNVSPYMLIVKLTPNTDSEGDILNVTGAIPTSEGAFQPLPTAGDHHFGHTLHNATNIKHGCPETSAKSLVAVAKMAAILSGVMVTSTAFFFSVQRQARIPSLL